VGAVARGEARFESFVMGGKGVAEVNVVVVAAARPVDSGVGQQRHPDSVRVAVGNEVRHLVKGGEQRFPQQRDIVKIKDCMDSHHRVDNLSRRGV
jgi:hypothetical protein